MSNKIAFIIIIGLLLTCAPAKAGFLDNVTKINIMPDNPLYVLKTWYEKILVFISFGDAKKAERYSKLAEEKLNEAQKMAERGKDDLTKKLLSEYEKYFNLAMEKTKIIQQKALESAKQKALEKLNQTIENVSESTLKNQEILLKVYELVPAPAKEVIERIIQVTKTGYERASKAVSGVKKEELKQRANDIKTRAQNLIKNWKTIFGE
jgi:hypothetical protein